MFSTLLNQIKPEVIAQTIRENPKVVQTILQKFDCYKTFGQSLTLDQQVCLSKNLHKLDGFFKTEQGKHAISNLMTEFTSYTQK
jgi:hypothetical protein